MKNRYTWGFYSGNQDYNSIEARVVYWLFQTSNKVINYQLSFVQNIYCLDLRFQLSFIDLEKASIDALSIDSRSMRYQQIVDRYIFQNVDRYTYKVGDRCSFQQALPSGFDYVHLVSKINFRFFLAILGQYELFQVTYHAFACA